MLLAGLAAGDTAQQQFWQLFTHFSGKQVGLPGIALPVIAAIGHASWVGYTAVRLKRQQSHVPLCNTIASLLQGQEAADACASGVGRGSGFSLDVQRTGADDARRFNARFV